MLDRLLPYYERELGYLRDLSKEFAEQYPKVAGRLQLQGETVADPHVERLMEAFAFLTARIHLKLDDEFPEITEALLGLLYPHYLRPVPSLTIVQFELNPADTQLTGRYPVPAGSKLLSRPVRGMPCRFRTCYPVELWPVRLAEASLEPVAGSAFARRGVDAVAMLRLTLECFDGLTFEQLGVDRLRLFLDGEGAVTHGLLELLLTRARGVVLVGGDGRRLELSAAASLRPVGFEPDEGLLDYGARSFLGYRLLTEYFAFPEKFLFVDLIGLDAAARAGFGPRMEVRVPIGEFERADRLPLLVQNVDRDTFRLGCAPAINLFEQTADPIRLDHRRSEYPVEPDIRRPWGMEVYGIQAVHRIRRRQRDEEVIEVPPFYGLRHAEADDGETGGLFWYARRRPSPRRDDEGTEVDLVLVDAGFEPAQPSEDTLSVTVTCTNRDLPARLPFGGGSGADFELEGGGAVSRIRVLRKPTGPERPAMRGGAQWRLISHLSLNHLSIVEGGRDALLEILSLYNFNESLATRRQITGIVGVDSRPDVARIGPPRHAAFCRGLAVDVTFDEDAYVGGSAYLLAAVLDRFLSLYASLNSFTRLTAFSRQREGVLASWPPRTGEGILT